MYDFRQGLLPGRAKFQNLAFSKARNPAGTDGKDPLTPVASDPESYAPVDESINRTRVVAHDCAGYPAKLTRHVMPLNAFRSVKSDAAERHVKPRRIDCHP
jgi:hypothetical protein